EGIALMWMPASLRCVPPSRRGLQVACPFPVAMLIALSVPQHERAGHWHRPTAVHARQPRGRRRNASDVALCNVPRRDAAAQRVRANLIALPSGRHSDRACRANVPAGARGTTVHRCHGAESVGANKREGSFVQVRIARTALCHALGLALAGIAGAALAQDPSPAQQSPAPAPAGPAATDLDSVVVTGYRQSLQYSTDAKRESTGFTDSIFSEDIGKFPDTNIAESLARIPGIQIDRDVNGEGLNVGIRGLPQSFTKTIINGGEA